MIRSSGIPFDIALLEARETRETGLQRITCALNESFTHSLLRVLPHPAAVSILRCASRLIASLARNNPSRTKQYSTRAQAYSSTDK
ncbi:hypothetical protein PSAB6_340048 [Paraburkholderia sabiae]|nr:hypothetical protein PSAB6_340048 [Paraburkholderia sabiae]